MMKIRAAVILGILVAILLRSLAAVLLPFSCRIRAAIFQGFSCCISATVMLKTLLMYCSGLYDNMLRIGADIMLRIRAAVMVRTGVDMPTCSLVQD
jgi:hypothetical protein